jgi:hypothetical protein
MARIRDSTVYRIAKWDEVFERAESRKLKALTWVSVPTSFNSNGYQCMLDEFQDTAPAIYGAWCALVAIAASCTVRGTLCNSRGSPLPTTHLARISGFPRPIFDQLIDWASRTEIGWLVPSTNDEISEKLRENGTSGDRRGIVGGSSGDSPDYQTRPDQTEPDLTQPNPTQPDKTGAGLSSVVGGGGVGSDCRSLTEAELLRVDSESVNAFGGRLSDTLLGFGLDQRSIGRTARMALAAGVRSAVLETARAAKAPSVRSPKRYWDAAIKKIFAEAGFDFAASMKVLQEIADRKAATA